MPRWITEALKPKPQPPKPEVKPQPDAPKVANQEKTAAPIKAPVQQQVELQPLNGQHEQGREFAMLIARAGVARGDAGHDGSEEACE